MKLNTQRYSLQIVVMLSVIYAECHIQPHYAECRYAECRSAESSGATPTGSNPLE
jgi:hypothetical protein